MSTWPPRSSQPVCVGVSVAKVKTNDLLLIAGGGALIWWLLSPRKSAAQPSGTMSMGTQPQGFTKSKPSKELKTDSFSWASIVKTANEAADSLALTGKSIDSLSSYFGEGKSKSNVGSKKKKINSPSAYLKGKNVTCGPGKEWNADFNACWDK